MSVLERGIREYDFVLLTNITDSIVRVDSINPNQASVYWPPYDSLPPVRSHVHPYFIICDVGMKDRHFHPELTFPSLAPAYPNLTGERLERVRLCRRIYEFWMSQHAAALARSKTKSKSRQSSAHSSTSRQSNPSRHAKRKRDDDDDNSLETIGEGYSPARNLGRTNSPREDSPCTPESSDDEDELDPRVDRDNSVEEPYQNKVGNWIKDVGTSECFIPSE